MNTPTPTELIAWYRRWTAIKKAAYAELVASYTPEQKAIVKRMNHAAGQATLCNKRLGAPDGYSGKRTVAWPEPPPAA